jgi:hypothetical protein
MPRRTHDTRHTRHTRHNVNLYLPQHVEGVAKHTSRTLVMAESSTEYSAASLSPIKTWSVVITVTTTPIISSQLAPEACVPHLEQARRKVVKRKKSIRARLLLQHPTCRNQGVVPHL